MKKNSIKSLQLNKTSIANLHLYGGREYLIHYTANESCEGPCGTNNCATALATNCNNTETVCGAYCSVSSG
ncbi:hypothetical protein ACJD0Z_18335 [Flavobacteriaceae bacterium M23B6Z8]